MRSITVIILLNFVAQGKCQGASANHIDDYARGPMDMAADSFMDMFSERALKASNFRDADLDNTTIAKAGHLAMHPSANLQYGRLGQSSGAVPPTLRGPSERRGCGMACASLRDDGNAAEALPISAEAEHGRRHVGLALGGLAMAVAQPKKAAAAATASKKALDAGFNVAVDGLKYRDLIVGDGASPKDGSTCRLTYEAQIVDTPVKSSLNRFINKEQGIKVVAGAGKISKAFDLGLLGAGDMPPMKKGGARLILASPSVAYGEEGVKCGLSSGCPEGWFVPPKALVKYTIQLTSFSGP